MTWRYGSTRWQLEGGGHENTSEKAFRFRERVEEEEGRRKKKNRQQRQGHAAENRNRLRVLFLQLKASQHGLLQRLRHSLMRQAVAVGVFLLFQYYLNRNGAVAVAGVTMSKRGPLT